MTLMEIFNTEKVVDQIMSDINRKKLGENSHDKWQWKRCFAGKCEGYPVREMIQSHLALGHKVKAGYTCTQIRGYHDRWILILHNTTIKDA
jgi:hypothetical protein